MTLSVRRLPHDATDPQGQSCSRAIPVAPLQSNLDGVGRCGFLPVMSGTDFVPGEGERSLFRRPQVLLVTLVKLLALVAPLRAQDAAKIEIVPMLGRSVAVFSVAFLSDGGGVLSGGDKTVKPWDIATGALIHPFDIGQSRATIRERPRRPSRPAPQHSRLGARPGGTP